MLSEYRQQFGDYHTELNREDYLYRSGRKDRRETAQIFSEYSDLFKLSVVDDLRGILKEVSCIRVTERASIERLIAFALEGHIAGQVREISEEIENYQASAQIDWNGQKIGFHHSAELLVSESDHLRRRDLYARRSEVIKGAQDLMAERLARIHRAARELNYESYLAMYRELQGIDYEKLDEKATVILSKTESNYVSVFSPLLAREANTSMDEAGLADLGYLQRYTRFDQFFSRERMIEIYRNLFADLGFKTEKQPNVQIDLESRPHKQAQAFCSPIRIPEEVKLVINLTGGVGNYQELLRTAGHAQHYAWTSRQLYPEFRIGGDRAVPYCWGLLLENLMLDERWLLGTFGLVESNSFRHALAVFRLMAVRQAAAKLKYEVEIHAGKLPANAGARFAELMTAAVRVQYDETEYLSDLGFSFYPAAFLRACALESQLREYLKSKFGSRWWTSSRAGDMLIDLWNTGERYSAEELASMIGLGELDFDWLAGELLGQIEK